MPVTNEKAPPAPAAPKPRATDLPADFIFRAVYRDLSEDEKALLKLIKYRAHELNELFKRTKSPERYTALASTALEQSVMWAVKEITG